MKKNEILSTSMILTDNDSSIKKTNIKPSATAPISNKEDGKLSVIEKIGYGLGDTASNILYQAWSFFLMIFYTDVFGIDAKVASFLFLITRVTIS
jgi:hypothetical protein